MHTSKAPTHKQRASHALTAWQVTTITFVMNAMVECQVLQLKMPRLDAYSLEDIRRLQLKYRESTLRSISFFEARAKELELPNEKRLAQPFLQEAEKVRKELDAAP